MSIKIAAVDDNLNLPAAVRAKMAGNLADRSTPEGAALGYSYASARVLFPNGTDDTAAVTAALALCRADGKPLQFASGYYRINAGIVWDPTAYSIIGGRDVTLDFTAMTSGTAITLASSTLPGRAFRQLTQELRGLTIAGPTADATTVDGINTTGSGGAASPALNLRDLKITGFRDQIVIGDQTWCLMASRLAMTGWRRRCINYAASVNAGENLSFDGCIFYDAHNNAGTAVILYAGEVATAATFNFTHCSFDYCDLLMDVRQGQVNLTACYLEDENTGPMIRTQAGPGGLVVSMIGGRVFVRAAAPDRTSIVDHISGNLAQINFIGTVFTTYPRDYEIVRVLSGTPVVRVVGCYITEGGSDGLKQVTPGNRSNLLWNGGFDLGTTAAWTMGGTGGTPTVQTDVKRTGTHSLRYVSAAAGQRVYGQQFGIQPGQAVVGSYWVKAEGVTSGRVRLYLRGYAQDGTTVTGNDSFDITATTDWRPVKRFWNPPPGTARVEFRLSFDDFIGTAYVDDCYMAIV